MAIKGIYNADGITTYTVADQRNIHSKSFNGKIVYGDTALVVSAQSTPNMTVKVSSGECSINGAILQNTASINLTIASNNASYARIDAIVAYISGTTYQLKVLQGTPAATPKAPDCSANTYIKLAEVTVGVGVTSIQSSSVKDYRSQFIIKTSLSEFINELNTNVNTLINKNNSIQIYKTGAEGYYINQDGFMYQWKAQNTSTSNGIIDIRLALPKTFNYPTSVNCNAWLLASDWQTTNDHLAAGGYLKTFMLDGNTVRVIASGLTPGVAYWLRVQCQGF